MPQQQAGFFINAIIKEFVKEKNNDRIKNLLHYLSHFDLKINKEIVKKSNDAVVAVLNNIISRGLPTYPSTFIEDRIANTFIKTKKIVNFDSFSYKFINNELEDEIIRALHIIDPRFSCNDIQNNFFDDNSIERELITDFIPINIGNFFVQLLSKKREVNSIFENSTHNDKFINIDNESFSQKKFDYSLELPFTIKNKAGLTIEISSPKENLNKDFLAEEKLYKKLNQINWNDNLLISELNNNQTFEIQSLINFSFDEYFDILRKNYNSPLYATNYGLDAMQMALTPLAIARIQKTILNLIAAEELKLSDKKWKICIIERDVPAAFLAIEDLKQHFEKLFKLEGKFRKLPEIDLTIFFTPEFEEAELNILYQGKIEPLEDFDSKEQFDVLIDISVLRRSNFDFEKLNSNANTIAQIRSVEYVEKKRQFFSAPKIWYKTYLYETTNKTFKEKEHENATKDALNFFFKNIFHREKLSFLQLKFLIRVLSNQNSLTVVPAHEQKELIYKFASILQPGISIVITPLMSGLKFQFDDLFDNMIDGASYFSASTQKIYDKYSALNKLRHGQSLFNYITPDRLHLPEFRQVLKETFENNVTISHIIIDQAHCVSEWSQDFRPLYATIPNNIKIIAENNKIPQFACFSETSSYDVIKDIKLKFNIKDENFVKVDLNLNNVKLKFVEVDSISNTNLKEADQALFNNKLQIIKQNLDKRTIVFNNQSKKTAELLNSNNLTSLYFDGTIGDKLLTISTLKSRTSYKNFRDYINNKADVLSSTYSLGIGCDINAKKIYLDVPTSIELFIQTLGKTHSSKNIDVNVLFGNNKIAFTQKELDFDEEGNLIEKQYSSETETENISRSKAYEHIYPDLKKELQIIEEIMTMVTYPKETIADILIRRIHYSFDKWVHLESQPELNPTKIYIYDDENYSIGYIDYELNQIVNMSGTNKSDIAQQILSFLKFDIEKIVSNGAEIFHILNDKISVSTSNGINNIWTEIKHNEQSTLTVEFYNDAISKFKTKFAKNENLDLNHNQIIDIYEKTYGVEDFLDTFIAHYKFDKELYSKYNLEIQKLYWNFRNYFDTVPAIYRLFSIGILDDFIIDFQNQQFTLIFTKKTDTQVINNIHKKISPFICKNQALEVFEKIPKTKGNSIISKSVNYYLQFVFFNILQKRSNSYNIIFELIKSLKNNENRILPLLNNYFSAKYLIELEAFIDNNDLSVIDKYFNKKSLLIDDLEHLNRSSTLLLNVNTQNHNLLIVNGLSGLLLNSEEQKEFYNYLENLTKGITIFRDKFSTFNIEKQLNTILELTSKFNLEVRSKIENILFLKIHTNWITNFNKKLKNILS
ncbi:MAG: hypothetical protein JXR68_09915 [Bacteroidales bacterium]|nr:hypothetical protein [Bacteroidales bacterium]